MRKTITKIITILVSLIVIIGTAFWVNINFKKYDIKEKYSFSETANIFYTLNDREKSNIISKLRSEITENDSVIGFITSTTGTDPYLTDSLAEKAKTPLNPKALKSQKTKTTQISSKPLIEEDIDVVTTVYGVVLAKNSGYAIDKQKLQNYINQNYNKINSMENTADIINNLYYTIILDELNNNYNIDKDRKYIQNIIDKSIKTINFNDDITNDIVIARKALEIVMDLQIHDINVHINNDQIGKIRKGLAKAAINQNAINSLIITDLFIIDDIIKAGIVNKEMFYRVYKTLTIDGGSKAISAKKENTSDIYSTYRFFICFDRMNNYSNLPEQQKYVKSLQISDGIYRSNLLDNSLITLESILYSNSIAKLEVGVDKQ